MIPYPDRIFDVLIVNHMLYHVPDRPKALSDCGAEGVYFEFTLENGLAQLCPYFTDVSLRFDSQGKLHVTKRSGLFKGTKSSS